MRDPQLRIETPEGIRFSLTLAGPFSRFMAVLLDLMVIGAASTFAGRLLQALGALNRDLARALFVLASFAITIGYAIVLEWRWRGQTLGKRLFKLRVIDREGLPLRFSQVMMRNLLRSVDMLPLLYMVGGAAAWLTRYGQRLGDLAANTVVVRDRPAPKIDLTRLLGGKYNSFAEHPYLAARLRRHVPPEAVALAVQALVRRDELDPAPRMALFRDLAAYFQRLVPVPEDLASQLTDEQYVRNVVELAAKSRSA